MSYQLAPDTVVDYLRRRGVIGPAATAIVEPMAGGVSNDVLAVSGPGVDLVVKQALPRLRVAREWLAPTDRILAEAAAERLAANIRPDDVPELVDVDPEAMTLTLRRADRSLANWKVELLASRADPSTAISLAEALATWHNATAGQPELTEQFGNKAFAVLRIDPFYRAAAERHQMLAERIESLADELMAARICLVHGDFSPKNVLAQGAQISVLDWEVAHVGDPVFDLAFLETHLLLKAIHRPASGPDYRRLAEVFADTYATHLRHQLQSDPGRLAAHTACLLLARVDGKSPADYLTDQERGRARNLAVDALSQAATTSATLWEHIDG